MADLVLKGTLELHGLLTLKASGGKVKVQADEVLVELPPAPGNKHGSAPIVNLPPPPAGPINTGMDVVVFNSFNKTVMAGNKAIVAMGLVLQGLPPMWPGMLLPSQKNSSVTINQLKINVKGDQAIIFPSGGTANLTDNSGQ